MLLEIYSCLNSATTPYKCLINTRKRPQHVITTPYDFLKYEKTGEIFRVVFTEIKL